MHQPAVVHLKAVPTIQALHANAVPIGLFQQKDVERD
jgi:hypothetical protein